MKKILNAITRQWPQTHWRGRCAALACLQPELQQERKPRPSPEQALNCPRCNSTNTKFCYYNNYSFSQPRYFCKGCRRYWTKGGTLRNVPVGGGCRKNKRSSSSKKPQDHNNATSDFGALLPALPPQPPLVFDSRGLTIPFPPMHRAPGLVDDPVDLALGSTGDGHPPPQAPGFFDVLCTGFLDGGTDALDDLYYGFSGNHGKGENAEGAAAVTPSPLDGLYGETLLAKQEASCKSAGDNKLFLQWQVGGDGGMVVDTAGRNYWNENAGSAWHSLINSSLI